MSSSEVQTRRERSGAAPGSGVLLVPVLTGAAVALGMGVYGSVPDPAGYAVNLAGFSGGLAAKAWLTTGALALAVLQVVTAAGMWGRLGLGNRPWTGPVHRWTGRLAVLLTLPVVVHCLYALGLDSSSPRTLAHSLLGAFFFGAFTTKMLALSRHGVPARTLPVAGGLLFVALVGVWLTSALWFFTTFGLTR